jgi:hypothetical protein
MGRGRLARSHRLHLRQRLRLRMRISRRLRMCNRSGRMHLFSGLCHLYKFSRRRRFLRVGSFHRVDMSRHRRRV